MLLISHWLIIWPMKTNHVDAVRRAAKLLGSQRALAMALGVAPVNVSQWLSSASVKGRPVPPKQCVRIEALTKGAVSRRELRPDDWRDIWPELECAEPIAIVALAEHAQVAVDAECTEAGNA